MTIRLQYMLVLFSCTVLYMQECRKYVMMTRLLLDTLETMYKIKVV